MEEVVASLDLPYKQVPRGTEKFCENMGQVSQSASHYLNHETL